MHPASIVRAAASASTRVLICIVAYYLLPIISIKFISIKFLLISTILDRFTLSTYLIICIDLLSLYQVVDLRQHLIRVSLHARVTDILLDGG